MNKNEKLQFFIKNTDRFHIKESHENCVSVFSFNQEDLEYLQSIGVDLKGMRKSYPCFHIVDMDKFKKEFNNLIEKKKI